MNAAAAAKTGWQRAASHNSGANSTATGPTVAKSSDRRKMATPLARASAAHRQSTLDELAQRRPVARGGGEL